MKTFVCIVLLAVSAMAAPAPEGKREKRGGLYSGFGYSSLGSYSLGPSIISHSPIVYSAPATVIHEPAIVSVKKIVHVPEVVTYKRIVPVARIVSAPRISYSYAPSYSAGWW